MNGNIVEINKEINKILREYIKNCLLIQIRKLNYIYKLIIQKLKCGDFNN